MKALEKETRPRRQAEGRKKAGFKACKDYTRPTRSAKGGPVADLMLCDINAYVAAWDRMSYARRRLFGLELSNVVQVPSGQWLARAATLTGKRVERNAHGDLVLDYRGLKFMCTGSAAEEVRA